jgi:hypothetical protein
MVMRASFCSGVSVRQNSSAAWALIVRRLRSFSFSICWRWLTLARSSMNFL